MKNLRKYPQNIFLLLFFLLVCIVIIFLIKEYSVFSSVKQKEKTTSNFSLPSLAKFKLKNKLTLGNKTNPLSLQEFEGLASIDFNLLNQDIRVGSIDMKGSTFKIDKINKVLNIRSIKLDQSHPSVGTINKTNGKIDLSVWIMLEMNIDKSNIYKMSIIFPLTGNINKKSGSLNLKGEASLPPEILGAPVPVEISILAASYN